jgi:hypothetical protein
VTLVILLILGALWLVVLAPAFIKRWIDRRPAESIDSFHHQLHLLERTGPKLVAPAYRLETAEPSGGLSVGASGYPAVSSMPRRPNLVLLRPVGESATGSGDEVIDEASGEHYLRVAPIAVEEPTSIMGLPGAVGYPGPAGPKGLATHSNRMRNDDERRLRARRRRGDILLGLVATGVFTAVIGIIPSLHALWFVSMAVGVALAGYLGLMMYATAMASELRPSRHAHGAHARGRAAAERRGAIPAADHGPGEADQRLLATAGYPGAWDTLFEAEPARIEWSTAAEAEFEDEPYEPRRAAAGG